MALADVANDYSFCRIKIGVELNLAVGKSGLSLLN